MTLSRYRLLVVPQGAKVFEEAVEEVPNTHQVFDLFVYQDVRCTSCQKEVGYTVADYDPDTKLYRKKRDYMYLRCERIRLTDTLDIEETQESESDLVP